MNTVRLSLPFRLPRAGLVLLPCILAAALLSGLLSFGSAMLAAPTPLLPASGDTVVTPTFSWLPAPGGAYYELEVGPQSNPATVYWSGLSDYLVLTPDSAANLPNEPLYWRLRAYDAANSPGEWSARVNFTKHIPAPALLSPARYAAVITPSFAWSVSEGAAYYQLELSSDPAFSSVLQSHKTYNQRLTPTSAFPNGTYAWRVVPYDAAGHAGTISPVYTFTKHLPAPLLLAPADRLAIAEPRLAWERSAGAVYYQVELSLEDDFDPLVANLRTSNLSLVPTSALAEGTYYWRVVPLDAALNRGWPSPRRSFIQQLAPPVLALPPEAAVRSLPNFGWLAAAGAVTYRLELARDAAFTQNVRAYTTANTHLTPLAALDPGAWYWRVRSLDSKDHAGVWSPARTVAVISASASASSPEPLTPGSGEILASDPTFRWKAVAGADHYILKVSLKADFSTSYDTVTSDYPAYTPLLDHRDSYAAGTYYWRVEARTAAGNLIATGPAASFQKAVTVALDNPNHGVVVYQDPQFSWSSLPGADHYNLQIMRPDLSSYSSVTTDLTAYRTEISERDTYAAGLYLWKVLARDQSGNLLAESAVQAFTKGISETLLAPGAGAFLNLDPDFSWDALVGADHYYLAVGTNPDFSSTYDTLLTDYPAYTPLSDERDTFANRAFYWWKVQARDAGGNTIAVSQPQAFNKQETLHLFEPGSDARLGSAPSFRWSQHVGADHYYLQVSASPTFSSIYDSLITDYTTYTPYRAHRDTYAPNTYYWKVQARDASGNTVAESQSQVFTIDLLQPTTTPLGAPTATPTLTPTVTVPPTYAPGSGPTPTPPGPLPTFPPPPAQSRTIGSLVVFADSFTQLSTDLWSAQGRVRFGPPGKAYIGLLSGSAVLDYAAQVIEGSSDSIVHLLLDSGRSASLFAGPFSLDPGSGLAEMPANALARLAALGDMNVDETSPVEDFQFNALHGWAKGWVRVMVYPVEGVFNTALVDFTLSHDGVIAGGLGVESLSFEAAGVTIEVQEAVFTYTPNQGGKITIGEASIALPASLDLGAEGSVSDIVLSRSGLEKVGGGSISLSLPEMAVPGTSGKFNLAGAEVTLTLEGGGSYTLQGRADFSLPNIQSTKKPGTTYDGALYAEFELSQEGLHYVLMGGTIDPGLPIGQTGMALTGLEGRVTLRPEVRVQITGTLQSQLEIPPLGPVVSGTPSMWVKLDRPYEVGVSGEVDVLIFDAAEASLVLSQSNGLLGSVEVNYFPYALSGTGSIHVWRSGGEFHFTGSAMVTLGFKKGALGSYAGISLPPADFTFGSVGAQVGEFCANSACTSSVYGFKGDVNITINAFFKKITLASYAFFLDVNGSLDYGSSLDQYRLVDQPQLWAEKAARGLPLEARDVLTFTVGGTDLLLAGITWEAGAPQLTLLDPDGLLVEPAPTYPGMGYTQTLTSRTYFIEEPKPGEWQAQVANLTGIENYRFQAVGRNLPPELTASRLTALAVEDQSAPAGYLIEWTAVDSDPGTGLALYYDADQSGADGSLIVDGLDPAASSYLWDPLGVASGEYFLYARLDDFKNTPVTVYFSQTVAVANSTPPAAPLGLQAVYDGSLSACWQPNSEPDVTGYVMYLGSRPGVFDLGRFELGSVTCGFFAVPPWAEEVYLAVLVYDNSGNESPLSASVRVQIPHLKLLYLPVVLRK